MKINELLQEQQVDEVGVLQGIKGAVQGVTGGLAGIKGGYAAGKAAGVEQDLINRTVQKAMANWGQQQQRLKSAGRTPTVKDATDWFAQFSRQQPTSNPAGVGPGQITPWLQKEIAAYLVSKNSAQATPAQPEQPEQPEQPQQVAPKPLEVGAKTRAGTELIKVEPLTLKYKNQNYIRGGQQGEWTRFGSTKPIPPTEQAFLDNEEDELSGETQQSTQQQTTPTAEPQQQPAAEKPAATQELPDVSTLTPEERAELIKQIKQQLGQPA